AYRNSLRAIPVRETNEAVAALAPKVEQLNREVFEAEAAARRFRAESDQLTGGTSQLTLQQQRLATLSADIVRAEADLARSQARLEAARELNVRGGADTLPEVQQSRIIQDLIAQRVRVERQVNEARAVLLPAHPRMRQLNADLDGLRRSIRLEIQTIVASISKEVGLSQLRVDQLRNQIATLKQSAIENSSDEARLRSLEATAASKRNELARLQKQLEDNRTVVDINRVPVEATIVSMARANETPVFPKKASYTVLVMASTLMLGIFLSITRSLMAIGQPVAHNRRASDKARAAAKRAQSRRAADVPPSPNASPENGSTPPDQPLLAGSRPSSDRIARREPSGATLSDHARRFAAKGPDGGGFRLLVTGAVKDIDPSDEAIELVAELSDAGARVLLVDWTLDGRPLLADIDVGGASSLADLIAGRAEFSDIIVPLSDANVHYVRASAAPLSPELRNENAVNAALDALDEAYDHVVVFGRYDDARTLFETIEGRFDAGLTVAKTSLGAENPDADSFLGFDVADIEIVHHYRNRIRALPRQSVN
ncbi:MAG: hypothetical protein KKB37_15225, partial [Alphaproteobacteria bacterium]|nr:hypothetical protein [Alphaproteobacteria bacterium]